MEIKSLAIFRNEISNCNIRNVRPFRRNWRKKYEIIMHSTSFYFRFQHEFICNSASFWTLWWNRNRNSVNQPYQKLLVRKLAHPKDNESSQSPISKIRRFLLCVILWHKCQSLRRNETKKKKKTILLKFLLLPSNGDKFNFVFVIKIVNFPMIVF